MGFIPAALAKKIRLKKSKVIELADGELKVRIAPMEADSAFEVQAAPDPVQGKAHLFIGSCITEEGNPLFRNAADVKEFLKVIDIDDATMLLEEVTKMSKDLQKRAEQGNSDGTPAAT